MEEIKVELNDRTYNLKVADTEKKRLRGLQNVEKLKSNEGMIFVYDEPQEVSMWMKDTKLPLDLVFVDEDLKIKSVQKGEPMSEKLLTEEDVKYVIELKQNSGILKGHTVDLNGYELMGMGEDFDEDDYESEVEVDEDDKEPMLILDDKGRVQMELEGGERIFSRKNTKTLISMAKRAWKSKKDSDYKRLGRKVFDYLDYQNNKDDDYVEIK